MTDAPDDPSRAWPGPVLPPSDLALSRLAAREAQREDPASYEGPNHDPGQPWRAE